MELQWVCERCGERHSQDGVIDAPPTHPSADLRAELAEAERDEWKRKFEAVLYDYHNGTPCEQIAWAAERDSLRALLQRAREQLVMSDCPALKQEIDAALKGTP
jgi:hypothetical protein